MKPQDRQANKNIAYIMADAIAVNVWNIVLLIGIFETS
jgi:hypothetical protein